MKLILVMAFLYLLIVPPVSAMDMMSYSTGYSLGLSQGKSSSNNACADEKYTLCVSADV